MTPRFTPTFCVIALCGLAAACDAAPPPAPQGPALETTVSAQAAVAPAPSASGFDGARAWTFLERIVGFGPRPSGSQALVDTRNYIIQTLQSFGLKVQDQRFTASTPLGPIQMENLIVRIAGRRPERILLTGHYDTKLMPAIRFVGASDGGSSAAWLIEAARVLATRQGEFTYELVWFDGEEAVNLEWRDPDNRYGSRHYVEMAKRSNTLASIKAMILVDMIGDRDLEIRRDSNSTPWLKDVIFGTAKRLAYGHVFVDRITTVEDDHVPFLAEGIPSIDLIDLDTYPYWHTADDTIDKLSARSLQVVGDVVLTALPEIEAQLRR